MNTLPIVSRESPYAGVTGVHIRSQFYCCANYASEYKMIPAYIIHIQYVLEELLLFQSDRSDCDTKSMIGGGGGGGLCVFYRGQATHMMNASELNLGLPYALAEPNYRFGQGRC